MLLQSQVLGLINVSFLMMYSMISMQNYKNIIAMNMYKGLLYAKHNNVTLKITLGLWNGMYFLKLYKL
jgi:hypothetical protein